MRARAEASGGYLNIESIEGLGTEVTLTLPKSRVDQERPTTALLKGLPPDGPTVDTPRSDNWGPHSIVLCDDQRDLRDAVRLMMSDAPRFHVVGEASDGVTCLQRVREFRPDALIMEANPRYLSTASAVKWMHKQNRPVIGWGLGAPSPLRPSPSERGI